LGKQIIFHWYLQNFLYLIANTKKETFKFRFWH